MATTDTSGLEAGFAAAREMANTRSEAKFPVLGEHLLARPGRIIDLTRPLYEGMPMWFGHQKMFIFTNQDYDGFKRTWKTNAGFYARNLLMSEHTGSHTDAVNEYDPDGAAIDELPLSFYWGEAVCLDLSEAKFQKPDPEGRGYATEDVVRRAEEKLEAAGESIKPGDIVFGWFDYGDRTFPSQEFIDDFPGFSWDGAEYLAKKGVVNLGTDCAGVDNSLDVEFSAHMVCKKYGIVNTENLTRLGELVNTRFLFFGLPLHIQGGTGSPIRAIAYYPEN